MPFWAAAQLQLHRDRVALHLLQQAGFETYAPRLRERRIVRGRKVVATPLLFPGYAFVFIQMQWHTARWTPGVIRLVMDGVAPAVVPNAVITELQAREVGGLIELPAPFRPGDRVRIRRGAFIDHIGLVAGMKPHERVEVLLSLLGGQRRVTLPVDAIESAVLSFCAAAVGRRTVVLPGRRQAPPAADRPLFQERVAVLLQAHRDPGPGTVNAAVRQALAEWQGPPPQRPAVSGSRWSR